MDTKNFLILKVFWIGGMSMLMMFLLSVCSSQPTLVPTSIPPTQLSPAVVPPSPTFLPSTSTPEPPVLVTSMEEILGPWLSRCGGGPCTTEIRADGTYNTRYVKPTEGQGITQIDRGKITFADGVFHLESTSGYCETMPNGFYRAYLTRIEGKLYLRFEGTQKDECAERQSSISREMKSYEK